MVRAVDGASYSVGKGEFVCLIGESGSGKSVSVLSILGLIDTAPGIVGGEILFEGKNMLQDLDRFCSVYTNGDTIRVSKEVGAWRKKHRKAIEGIRGKRIGMIFQDPVSSLNPLFSVTDHIGESAALRFGKLTKKEKHDRTVEWLKRVRISSPESVAKAYPFQLSGGMAQRVMIATALAAEPDLLIADEPTTQLDATVQLDILNLLKSLQEEMHVSVLFITHDISIGSNYADRIAVMYAGKVIESGPVDAIFKQENNHPYTDGLFHAALKITTAADDKKFIKGSPPDSVNRPSGCPFHPRCELKKDLPDGGVRCEKENPYPIDVSSNHSIRCWKYETDN